MGNTFGNMQKETRKGNVAQPDSHKSANGSGVSNSSVKVCNRMSAYETVFVCLSPGRDCHGAQSHDFPVQIIALDN